MSLYDKIKADRAAELARTREILGIPSNKNLLLKLAQKAIRSIIPMDRNSNARMNRTHVPY